MLTCNYQYKLKPRHSQIVEIENSLTTCRKVWNYALAERKDWSNSRKNDINKCSLEKEYIIPANAPYPSYKLQSASLTEAKKVSPDLKNVNAQVLQQILRQLDRAFAEMKSLNKGFHRFKNKYRMRSFVFPQLKTNPITNNYIKLPGIGLVKMKLSRPIPEAFTLKQAVDKNYTSQICPNCRVHTGKKKLSERVHTCRECNFSCHRDFAASLVIRNRGVSAVGQPVLLANACGGDLPGFDGNIKLGQNL